MGSLDAVPFWHYNVPPELRTAACPAFLADLSDKDRRIIGTPDAAYTRLSWAETRAVVAANRLERFQRTPSDLRRYRAFVHALARRHGSVAAFVLAERLRWPVPVSPHGRRPFADARDVHVLRNDWPYGLDRRIVHLVVWTKFALATDPATGDLTDAARADIDAYVAAVFSSRLSPDRVVWFKNWSAIKSVHAVEHFHVLLFDPDPDFVRDVTGGDVPQCDKADL